MDRRTATDDGWMGNIEDPVSTEVENFGGILGLVVTLLGIFFYAILNMSQTAIMDVAPTRVQSSSMGVMGLCTVPFTIVHAWLASSIVTTYGIENIFVFAGVTGLIAAAILIPVKFHKTF